LGKLRVFSGPSLIALVAEHGFHEVRRRGSPIVLQRRTEAGTTTIPVPGHAELRVGTLLAIIRQSGLPRSLFERD
jgi:predicted RNA binding protein YcfA (HicA-like mRNA interferase family)